MKKYLNLRPHFLLVLGLVAGLCMLGLSLQGQEEDAKEKKKARISLEYLHTTDAAPVLRATVKTRVDRVYETVGGVKVNFYLETDDGAELLGEATSNEKGEARLAMDPKLASLEDSIKTRLFLASIEGDAEFEDADQDLEVTVSQLDMKLEEVDSTRMVRVFFGAPDSSGTIAPLGDVYVNFYVRRMFGNLHFGDDYETTDEEGIVAVALPSDIPGDRDGNLTVLARIEEDAYGIRTVEQTVPWGVPLVSDANEWEQTLWSARKNTPIYLLVIVNGMILGIWGVIIYIITQLFKIRKIGMNT